MFFDIEEKEDIDIEPQQNQIIYPETNKVKN